MRKRLFATWLEAEKNVLRAHSQLARLIVCDLQQNNELARISRWLLMQL